MNCKEGLGECTSRCRYPEAFRQCEAARQDHLSANQAMLRAEAWQVQTFQAAGLEPDSESLRITDRAEAKNYQAYASWVEARNRVDTVICARRQPTIEQEL